MALKKIHTITVKKRTGKDGFNKGVYDDEEQFNARYNNEVKLFKTETGVELATVGTVYYDPKDFTLAVGDMVKHNGNFAEIQAIAEYPSSNGARQVNVAYLTESG